MGSQFITPYRIALAFGTKKAWGWRVTPILRPLITRDVAFAVVGSVATAYYTGGRRKPEDIDIVIASVPEVALVAFEGLVEIAEKFCVRHAAPEFSATAIRHGDELVFRSESVVLHIVGKDAEPYRDRVVAGRRGVLLDRARIPLCTRHDLLALKSLRRTPKDLSDLELLTKTVVSFNDEQR